jgi:hypothetical protein
MDIIVQAMQRQRTLRFYYKGLLRVVIPTTYGYTAKGDLLMRGYQVGGYTSSSAAECWRTFKVAEVSRWQLSDGFDRLPSGGSGHDKVFVRIIAQT